MEKHQLDKYLKTARAEMLKTQEKNSRASQMAPRTGENDQMVRRRRGGGAHKGEENYKDEQHICTLCLKIKY